LRTACIAGDPKRLIVNGRDCFVHAVNYIPTQHFADVSEDFYARDMQLCRAANLGSLGVHGHLQPQACYDAADRAGMLVFQDFPLQWHYDAGDESNPGFRERACRQIAEMAYTFWNHPSIVYWACHNEPTRLFVPGMQPDARFDFDNQVLDAALAQRLRSVDPVRHVHEASGIGDDLHVYDGSLDGGSVYGVRARKAWFVSEYGFWTPGPGVTRWGDQGWPPDEEQVRAWLSRLSFGAWTFAFAGLPERYGSLDAWRRATEAYGAYLAKVQTEWFRIRRGDPFFALRWHFLVDWWGWAGGGLVDVDRRPKATYRALAEALRPLLVATSLPSSVAAPGAPLEFEIVAVNETRAPARLSVRWSWHETQRSLVIGSDDEAERRWEIRPPSAGSMVALPEAGAFPPPCESTSLADGRLEAEIGPEAAAPIGRVRVTAPTRALAGGTLQLAWAGEHNWFHVLSAEPGWFPGPGAFLVGPGLHERYP
jgi:beta-mannosidase